MARHKLLQNGNQVILVNLPVLVRCGVSRQIRFAMPAGIPSIDIGMRLKRRQQCRIGFGTKPVGMRPMKDRCIGLRRCKAVQGLLRNIISFCIFPQASEDLFISFHNTS